MSNGNETAEDPFHSFAVKNAEAAVEQSIQNPKNTNLLRVAQASLDGIVCVSGGAAAWIVTRLTLRLLAGLP